MVRVGLHSLASPQGLASEDVLDSGLNPVISRDYSGMAIKTEQLCVLYVTGIELKTVML